MSDPGADRPAQPQWPGMPPVQGLGAELSLAAQDVLYPGAAATLVDAVDSAERGERPWPRRSSWGLGDVGYGLLIWFILNIAASMVAVGMATAGEGTPPAAILVALAASWLSFIGWPIVVARWRGNGPVIDFGLRWRWSDLGWGVVYGIASLIVAIVLAVLTQAVAGEFESSAGDMAKNFAHNLVFLAILAVGAGLMAPIAEEIFFRGLTFSAFAKRRLPPLVAVVASAAVFAVIHLEPVRFLLLFGVGIVFGLARWHTGSTVTAIYAHMINNIPGAIAIALMGV